MADLSEILRDSFSKTVGHGIFNHDCFSATIGLYLTTCTRLLQLCLDSRRLSAEQLLMVLNFLKEYRVSVAACVVFGYKSGASYDNHVWEGLASLDELLPQVLVWLRLFPLSAS